METRLGRLWGEGEGLKGSGVDGPSPVLVEGANVSGPFGTVELEETATDMDGHAASAGGVGFVCLVVVLIVGRGVGHGVVDVGVIVVGLSVGVVPREESVCFVNLGRGGLLRRVGGLDDRL